MNPNQFLSSLFGKKQQPVSSTATPGVPPGTQRPPLAQQVQTFSQGLTSVRDIIAPSGIEVDFDHLKIGEHYIQTLFAAGYPRYVSANWLAPLISFSHSLEVSMFIYPQDSKEILDNLRRKVGEMEATIQSDIKRGRVIEPSVQVALEDALQLQQQLAKGAERFFQFALYTTIITDTLEELNQVSKQLDSMLASLLIITKKASLQMEEGFKSTLPICSDRLLITRNMDTTSLATTFPFTTSELTANEGILYGINEHNESLVIFDRFTLENANSVIFGKSIASWENVLIKQNNVVRMEKIGSLIENCITRNGITYRDEEMEGVKLPSFEVYSYDENLKGAWTPVSIAARKPFSKREKLYKITTKSGRNVTVTADHSLITLRAGKPSSIKGSVVKVGDAMPLPRYIPESHRVLLDIIPKELVPDWPQHLPQKIAWSRELLTLFGLITAEGYISDKLLAVYNRDPVVLSWIEKAAIHIGATVAPRFAHPNHTIAGYAVGPNSYAKLCMALGLCGRSGEKRVPGAIFALPNNLIAAYLRAYFEGDGTVSEKSISVTTKSYGLASDLTYLLLRFGIIARIHPKKKRATNTTHQGNTYYEITISGQPYLQSFADLIGFLTQHKNDKLAQLLHKPSNTNVDTIPTLQPVFNRLYRMLYRGDMVKSPTNLSPLKRGAFDPSPQQLQEIVQTMENRIAELKTLQMNIVFLNKLPSLETLVRRGALNKKLNRALWQELGHSWQLMKKKVVVPGTINVLRVYKTITGDTISLTEVKQVLYETFKETGVSLQSYNKNLWSSIINESRRPGDTAYPTLFEAVQFLKKRYRSLQLTLRHSKRLVNELKMLSQADLFWDPIVSIEKIKHNERFVYDLTVDNHVFLTGYGGLFVHNSGGGKSYMVKLEILRSLMFDTEVLVIDPESEYEQLTKATNGEYITFSFNSKAKINPFDLAQVITEGENELGSKILSLHGLFRVIMGTLTPEEDALLDKALILTYRQKGITPDPETQKKEPPLMEDLYKTLVGMEEANAKGLADRIEKFIKGSLAGIFNQKSNISINNPFTVFSIRDLADELRPIAMYIILDFIWTKVRKDLKKRILIVDEAWFMMRHPDSANFLNSIAKRARKYYLGLTTITQDVEDFLTVDIGKAIVQNSSLQILLKQSSAAIDKIAGVFYLSEGEKHLLLSADVGEGLFFAGRSHVAIRVIASPDEHKLATTNPKEVSAQRTADAAAAQSTTYNSPASPAGRQPTTATQPIVPQMQPMPNQPLQNQPSNPSPVSQIPTLANTSPTVGVNPRPIMQTIVQTTPTANMITPAQ